MPPRSSCLTPRTSDTAALAEAQTACRGNERRHRFRTVLLVILGTIIAVGAVNAFSETKRNESSVEDVRKRLVASGVPDPLEELSQRMVLDAQAVLKDEVSRVVLARMVMKYRALPTFL